MRVKIKLPVPLDEYGVGEIEYTDGFDFSSEYTDEQKILAFRKLGKRAGERLRALMNAFKEEIERK